MLKVLLFLLCVSALASSRAGALELSEEYIEDASRALTAQEIVAKMEQLPWKKVEGRYARFGHSRSRFWFRFRLPLAELKYGATESVLVEIPFAYFEPIEMYRLRAGALERNWISGTAVPVSERGNKVLRTGSHTFRKLAPLAVDNAAN